MSDLRCPSCNEPLNFAEGCKHWIDEFGDDYDLHNGEAVFFIYCSSCKSEGGAVVSVRPFTAHTIVTDPMGNEIALPTYAKSDAYLRPSDAFYPPIYNEGIVKDTPQPLPQPDLLHEEADALVEVMEEVVIEGDGYISNALYLRIKSALDEYKAAVR